MRVWAVVFLLALLMDPSFAEINAAVAPQCSPGDANCSNGSSIAQRMLATHLNLKADWLVMDPLLLLDVTLVGWVFFVALVMVLFKLMKSTSRRNFFPLFRFLVFSSMVAFAFGFNSPSTVVMVVGLGGMMAMSTTSRWLQDVAVLNA
eukprot:c12511_g2_i1.p1 GENE.c12511_g2_i1~~c12511_g2_i1.p1  ORF type:complete len:148 (-),score=40.12 c12511_g2_i1:451-894(-)